MKGNCAHTANCTLHPPAWGHQEHFFPIPSLFVKEECGKKSWKWKRLNKGSSWVLVREKSFNPITESPLPTFISDKLNVSGQIIYFLYWKLTPIKNQWQNWKIYKNKARPLIPFLFLVILHLTKWSLEALSEIGSFWNPSSSSITCPIRKDQSESKGLLSVHITRVLVGRKVISFESTKHFFLKKLWQIYLDFKTFPQKLWSFSFQIWYSAYHQVDI